MKLDEFDFHLPENLIAQTPLKERTNSRLLAVNKQTGELSDKHFYDVADYFEAGDVLVLNDTKVLPARLFGIKEDTGAKIEMLLLKPIDTGYEVLIRPSKKVSPGTKVVFGEGKLQAVCIEKFDEGIHHMELIYDGILENVLDELGEMPLPPYIKEKLDDKDRYQTVFARESGSAAAPTAGLHFTETLLAEIKNKGVDIVYITLHVGLGTFRPVAAETIEDHKMHSEFYTMTAEAADMLNQAKADGKKIISVGTTSTRTLETIIHDHGEFKAASGFTDIFIYPGFEYKAVDVLITNFHLPKSSLVMLVSAFSSRENILNAYAHAVESKYRFFSFGDAMILY
ncbi:S-adenosylmethionine:tRNA ribosyltransferase-isomerase [Jeotgalicoccus aerolatus]|uniref:S-adenosylmethionine:tRNA ribosyltransferase-isomerase n=1 Tax=Jeotgalicoccus aerolatus TaxID=709510 RepID=A0ABS4HLM4_9STAP|nr:tRNA preQ1(34) S-adenosylmethionine ribosyltransferase-isomerase QueA [Jeotgalicoccus aerolatus]MBP1951619.1 S-adenosylmethionine:tRNA ribosyltransferase-isomerase [Jeotgalicoccus aerolatus]GGD96080.1 S-adenosylmethionine:tRNA ribosyltransferase-isomerase [Jeotgalicoccus aerolatus]CAD2075920.1 S-adenosylmethionine:tRNA ribosyltransferase-isomerase [Jeotgalicoccus aerolatus]